MNYAEQQKYLKYSRVWGVALAVTLFALAGACLDAGGTRSRLVVVEFGLAMLALGTSVSYSPDYLQLGVDPGKHTVLPRAT
jgi:hypothetical protein